MNKDLLRRREKINDNIEIFVMKDIESPNLDINITVLYSKEKALLIDAGYFVQANCISEILSENGISVEGVLLSHYHPDHAAGISAFKPKFVYCSEHYIGNYKRCSEVWDVDTEYFKPTHLLKSGDSFNFEQHVIKIHDSKSHSEDSILIEIDNAFIHVGDLIMRDVDNRTTCPYISLDGDIEGYLKSLDIIRANKDELLLLSHGMPLLDLDEKLKVVEDHIGYFNGLLELKSNPDFEIHLPSWAFEEWHQSNVKFLNRRNI